MSIRIAAVGLSHPHIYNQVDVLVSAGAKLIWFWGDEPEKGAEFAKRYPQATLARSIDEVLDDNSIDLIASASIPSERAPLGIRAMQRGKDYSCAKPGFTSLEQLAEARRVQAETKRIYTVHFGERYDNSATITAADMARAGEIGHVVQTLGLGPHRVVGHIPRPDWFFDRQYYGGILNDLASHQIDQFLYFTGSTSAEIVQAQVSNTRFHQYPNFEDFGDLTIRSDCATGYVRVDWLNTQGLPTWGDVRLFVLGTEGYMEIRKTIDIASRPGTNHLFVVNQKETRYIDCIDLPMPYGSQLISDVLNRTETAVTQAHVFLASELTLQAQIMATLVEFKAD